jgi:hypothetical protein
LLRKGLNDVQKATLSPRDGVGEDCRERPHGSEFHCNCTGPMIRRGSLAVILLMLCLSLHSSSKRRSAFLFCTGMHRLCSVFYHWTGYFHFKFRILSNVGTVGSSSRHKRTWVIWGIQLHPKPYRGDVPHEYLFWEGG